MALLSHAKRMELHALRNPRPNAVPYAHAHMCEIYNGRWQPKPKPLRECHYCRIPLVWPYLEGDGKGHIACRLCWVKQSPAGRRYHTPARCTTCGNIGAARFEMEAYGRPVIAFCNPACLRDAPPEYHANPDDLYRAAKDQRLKAQAEVDRLYALANQYRESHADALVVFADAVQAEDKALKASVNYLQEVGKRKFYEVNPDWPGPRPRAQMDDYLVANPERQPAEGV